MTHINQTRILLSPTAAPLSVAACSPHCHCNQPVVLTCPQCCLQGGECQTPANLGGHVLTVSQPEGGYLLHGPSVAQVPASGGVLGRPALAPLRGRAKKLSAGVAIPKNQTPTHILVNSCATARFPC
jgi:hypothetical protein